MDADVRVENVEPVLVEMVSDKVDMDKTDNKVEVENDNSKEEKVEQDQEENSAERIEIYSFQKEKEKIKSADFLNEAKIVKSDEGKYEEKKIDEIEFQEEKFETNEVENEIQEEKHKDKIKGKATSIYVDENEEKVKLDEVESVTERGKIDVHQCEKEIVHSNLQEIGEQNIKFDGVECEEGKVKIDKVEMEETKSMKEKTETYEDENKEMELDKSVKMDEEKEEKVVPNKVELNEKSIKKKIEQDLAAKDEIYCNKLEEHECIEKSKEIQLNFVEGKKEMKKVETSKNKKEQKNVEDGDSSTMKNVDTYGDKNVEDSDDELLSLIKIKRCSKDIKKELKKFVGPKSVKMKFESSNIPLEKESSALNLNQSLGNVKTQINTNKTGGDFTTLSIEEKILTQKNLKTLKKVKVVLKRLKLENYRISGNLFRSHSIKKVSSAKVKHQSKVNATNVLKPVNKHEDNKKYKDSPAKECKLKSSPMDIPKIFENPKNKYIPKPKSKSLKSNIGSGNKVNEDKFLSKTDIGKRIETEFNVDVKSILKKTCKVTLTKLEDDGNINLKTFFKALEKKKGTSKNDNTINGTLDSPLKSSNSEIKKASLNSKFPSNDSNKNCSTFSTKTVNEDKINGKSKPQSKSSNVRISSSASGIKSGDKLNKVQLESKSSMTNKLETYAGKSSEATENKQNNNSSATSVSHLKNADKIKSIPGLSYLIANKSKDKEVGITYDCVLCSQNKILLMNGSTMKSHLRTREHLLNFLEVDDYEMYESYKDKKSLDPSELFKEVCSRQKSKPISKNEIIKTSTNKRQDLINHILKMKEVREKEEISKSTSNNESKKEKELSKSTPIKEIGTKKEDAKSTPEEKNKEKKEISKSVAKKKIQKENNISEKKKGKSDLSLNEHEEISLFDSQEWSIIPDFQMFTETLVFNHKGRNPKQIVFALDNTASYIQTEDYKEEIKVVRGRKLNFDNLLDSLKSHDVLGKDSVIIVLCGIYSVVKATSLGICKKKKCSNQLIQYSIIPNISSDFLISKCLRIHEYILDHTSHDLAMFCELVPIDLSNDKDITCDNGHTIKNFLPDNEREHYLSIIKDYNSFVTNHARMIGFKSWNLLNSLFPSRFKQKGDTSVVNKKQVERLCLLSKILGNKKESMVQIDSHTKESSPNSSKDKCAMPETPKPSCPITEDVQLLTETLVSKHQKRCPKQIIFVIDDTDSYIRTRDYLGKIKIFGKKMLNFDNLPSFLKSHNVLRNDSVIIILCGIYSVVKVTPLVICKKSKCPNKLNRYSIHSNISSESIISKALSIHEYILNHTSNDIVMFCELVPFDLSKDEYIHCKSRHTVRNFLPRNERESYLSIIKEYNSFVANHTRMIGIKSWNLLNSLFPSRFKQKDEHATVDNKDKQVERSCPLSKILPNLNESAGHMSTKEHTPSSSKIGESAPPITKISHSKVQDVQSFMETLVQKHKNRSPKQIVFALDNTDISLQKTKNYLEKMKIVKQKYLNFDTLIDTLKSQDSFGKDSVIIILCGIFSVVSATPLSICERNRCSKRLTKYSIVSNISSDSLISKALSIHEYILNHTSNDLVMFCELVPIDMSNLKDIRCVSGHTVRNFLPRNARDHYLSVIKDYNIFVANHTRMIGFKSWNLLNSLFPSIFKQKDGHTSRDNTDKEVESSCLLSKILRNKKEDVDNVKMHTYPKETSTSSSKDKMKHLLVVGDSEAEVFNRTSKLISEDYHLQTEVHSSSGQTLANVLVTLKAFMRPYHDVILIFGLTSMNWKLIPLLPGTKEPKLMTLEENFFVIKDVSESMNDIVSFCLGVNPNCLTYLVIPSVKEMYRYNTHLLHKSGYQQFELVMAQHPLFNKTSMAAMNVKAFQRLRAVTDSCCQWKNKAILNGNYVFNKYYYEREVDKKGDYFYYLIGKILELNCPLLIDGLHYTEEWVELLLSSQPSVYPWVNKKTACLSSESSSTIDRPIKEKETNSEPRIQTEQEITPEHDPKLSDRNFKLFDKIVIITNQSYLFHVEKFREQDIEIFVDQNFDLVSAIENHKKSQPKRTLWLAPTGIFTVAHKRCSDLCSKSNTPCSRLLCQVVPNENVISGSTNIVDDVRKKSLSLMKEINSMLDKDSSFLILPPIPPSFMIMENDKHHLYHEIESEHMLYYFTTSNGKELLENVHTRLSQELISIIRSEASKINIPREPLEIYELLTKRWLSHSKFLTYDMFMQDRASIYSRFNEWTSFMKCFTASCLQNSLNKSNNFVANRSLPYIFSSLETSNDNTKYDHIIVIGCPEHLKLVPDEFRKSKNISLISVKYKENKWVTNWELDSISSITSSIIIFIASIKMLGNEFSNPLCLKMNCSDSISHLGLNLKSATELIDKKLKRVGYFLSTFMKQFPQASKVILTPLLPAKCVVSHYIDESNHDSIHELIRRTGDPYLLREKKHTIQEAATELDQVWKSQVTKDEILQKVMDDHFMQYCPVIYWQTFTKSYKNESPEIQTNSASFIKNLVTKACSFVNQEPKEIGPTVDTSSHIENLKRLSPNYEYSNELKSKKLTDGSNTTRSTKGLEKLPEVPKISPHSERKKFTKVIIITNHYYAHYMDRFRSPQVEILTKEISSLLCVVKAIKEGCKLQPSNTLWLLPTGIFSLAKTEYSPLCKNAYPPCYSPLHVITPDESIMTKTTDFVKNIGKAFQDLIVMVESVIDPTSSFIVLPPIPPSFLEIEEFYHYQYHGISLAKGAEFRYYYLATHDHIKLFNKYIITLNNELTKLAVLQCRKNNLSVYYFEYYDALLNQSDYHVKVFYFKDFVTASKQCENSEWFDSINKFINTCALPLYIRPGTSQDKNLSSGPNSKGITYGGCYDKKTIIDGTLPKENSPVGYVPNSATGGIISNKNTNWERNPEINLHSNYEAQFGAHLNQVNQPTERKAVNEHISNFALSSTDILKINNTSFDKAYIIITSNDLNLSSINKSYKKNITYIYHEMSDKPESDTASILSKLGEIRPNSVCFLSINFFVFTKSSDSPECLKFNCPTSLPILNINMEKNYDIGFMSISSMNKIMEFISFAAQLSIHVPLMILPLYPTKIYCGNETFEGHKLYHNIAKTGARIVSGERKIWETFAGVIANLWTNFMKTNYEKFFTSEKLENYIKHQYKFLIYREYHQISLPCQEVDRWDDILNSFLDILVLDMDREGKSSTEISKVTADCYIPETVDVVIWNVLESNEGMIFDYFKEMDPKSVIRQCEDHFRIEVPKRSMAKISDTFMKCKAMNNDQRNCVLDDEGTSQIFFGRNWKDLVTFGSENSLKLIIKSIRAFGRQVIEPKSKVFFISPSLKFLNMIESVVLNVLKEANVKIIVLGEAPVDSDCFDVFLGVPSTIVDFHWNLLNMTNIHALIVDDVTTILSNSGDKALLLTIFRRMKIKTNPNMKKMFVVDFYNSETANQLSALFELPLKEVTEADISKKYCSILNEQSDLLGQSNPESSKSHCRSKNLHNEHRKNSPISQSAEIKDGTTSKFRRRRRPNSRGKRRRSRSDSISQIGRSRSISPSESHHEWNDSQIRQREKRRRDDSVAPAESTEMTPGVDSPDQLMQTLGYSLYKEFVAEREKLKVVHKGEFDVYLDDPDMHYNYDKFYEEFCIDYNKKYGRNRTDQHKDRHWKDYWEKKVESLNKEDWKLKLNELLSNYNLKAQVSNSKSKELITNLNSRNSNANLIKSETSKMNQPPQHFSEAHSHSLSKAEGSRISLVPSTSFKDDHITLNDGSFSTAKAYNLNNSARSFQSTVISSDSSTSKYISSNSSEYYCSPSEKISVTETLTLLEQASSKLGMLGPAILAFCSSARNFISDRNKVFSMLREEENLVILKMALDKFQNLQKNASFSEVQLLSNVVSQTKRLMECAQDSPTEKVYVNVESLAAATWNKGPSFTFDLIKSAYANQGNNNPTKEEVDEIYLKIYTLHNDMS